MALYREISAQEMANILAQDEEERKRQALEQYNAQKAKLDNNYNTGGLGGFLGSIVGGIGKGIGDVGKGIYDLIGSGVASTKDLIEGKAGTQENLKAFKKDLYNTDSMKDAYAKSAGTALNAATTLATTAVPGLGAGGAAAKALGGVGANTVAGALGGVADELQQQGENANLESAANRAISGAVGGLVGGKVAGAIGNAKTSSKLGNALLNNKLATSTLGRGAIAGAAGGATGAGTSAALGGGDILGSAIQGATSGAISGAGQSALMAGANKALQGAKNKLGIETEVKTPKQLQETETKPTTEDNLDIPDYTTPRDYQGNELKINKKNIVQQIGDNIAKTGERIDNAELYNSLYSKTAADVVKNGSVEKLRKLGYTPADYAEAAKISTATNTFVDDIVKNSGASIVDNGLVDRIAQPKVGNEIATPTYQKVYERTVKGVLDKIEKGNMPGKYNASDLLKASRDVGQIANKYLKKATNVNGGDLATDAGALADALFDVKYELRNLATKSVDGFGDNYTKAQLTQRLQKLGATDAAIADMMEAKNIGEFINKTAKYEDARQMDYEMKSNELRRNAISGSKTETNPGKRIVQDSGAGELVSVVTRPIGKGVGKGAKIVGNAISKVGEQINNIDTNTQPINQDTLNLLGNFIARTEANRQANNNVQNARSAQDYQNLEDQLSANVASIDAEYAPQLQALQAQQISPAQQQLADIANGMNLALAAGDIDSYNKLASLYKTAYTMYELQNPTVSSTSSTGSTKLSKTQQQANAAALALDELEKMNPDYGYTVKDIPVLNLVNAGGNKYSSTADSLAMQIGYMLSGANIKEDEAKKIGSAYVPQPFDDEATRKYKLQQARNIIQQYQNTYTTDSNNNA